MPNYLIAGIPLKFTYQYPDYFSDRIRKYQIEDDQPTDYAMEVQTVRAFPLPSGNVSQNLLTQTIWRDGDQFYQVVYADATKITVHQMISYSADYCTIHIRLSDSYQAKLPEMEYLVSGMFFFEIALREHRVPIHASAIEVQKQAVVFSAPSGTGKSTHTGLWKKYLPNIRVINDDKPLLIFEGKNIYVAGTPWSGKTNQSENILVPIKAIVFLHQGKTNVIYPLQVNQKMIELMRNVYRPADERLLSELLDYLGVLCENVEMISYHCNISEDAFTRIYDHLYGGVHDEN